MKVFKIQKGEMFSTGGMCPKFSAKGKTWNTIGALKNHLNVVREARNLRVYDGCHVVVVELTANSTVYCSVPELIDQQNKVKREKEQKVKDRVEVEERQLLERLKKKYGP